MLPEYFEFGLPTRVLYGKGLMKQAGSQLATFGPRKAILITDAVLVKTGLADKVKEGLSGSQLKIVATFDDVPPNSTISAVESCAQLMAEHSVDLVIALGGGSVMDTAKVANLLAVKGGRLSDHMGAYLLDRSEKLLPSVCIPTTAGTGSEVTRVAVIADPANDVKLPFTEDQFLPDIALLDPEMTATMPGKLTAATGMDALTHAIEAYVDKEWSPPADAMALHAIKLISTNILKACACPEDLEARGAMLVGSFLAGVAFSHSMVGMVHGISHALGGVYHIPHGLANALVLPEVMEYNLEEKMERFVDIGKAMGVNYPQWVDQSRSVLKNNGLLSSIMNRVLPVPEVKDWVEDKARLAQDMTGEALEYFDFVDHWVLRHVAQGAIERVRTLNRQLAHLTGMPLNLRDAGIDDQLAKLDLLVSTAMEDGAMLYNPVEPTAEAVREIVLKLFKSNQTPLMVTSRDLRDSKTGLQQEGPSNVFEDSETLYTILGGFFEHLKEHPQIGPALAQTGLCIQFAYRNPSATITVDATGPEMAIHQGTCDLEPEVTMSMNADFAHLFWHGKANLVSALTRRLVKARGNVPKTLKLLPVLKPAYQLYPTFLRDRGFGEKVI